MPCLSLVGVSVTCRTSVGVGGNTTLRLVKRVVALEDPDAHVSSSTVCKI